MQYTVNTNSNFFQLIETFLNNHTEILFVVDNSQKFLGYIEKKNARKSLKEGSYLSITELTSKWDKTIAEQNKHPILPVLNDEGNLIQVIKSQHTPFIPVAEPLLGESEFRMLNDAFFSTWIANTGEYVDQFEKEFADFCGTKYAVAVTNGSDALILALKALDIKAGDEIIVPDATFVAVINAALHINATPVVVDVEQDSWCISLEAITKAITAKTKAIIAVHGFGVACDMGAIMDVANKHGIYVIEDCAEAHGAEYNGKKVGSIGHIGCFSFFANKIMTSGEGGICTTNDPELDDKIRLLKNHGMRPSPGKRYWYTIEGFNARMTNLHSAIGLAQLRRIESFLDRTRKLEELYCEEFKDCDFIQMQQLDFPNRKSVVWFPSALITRGDRDEYINEVRQKHSIDIRQMTTAFSLVPIYQKYIHSAGIGSKISEQAIHLPISLHVTRDTIRLIGNCFREVASRSK